MPQSMSSGIISLIPKGGDASTLRRWRPITLMSSVYKILVRMITSRLRPLLPDLIHSSQTGFVQDRSILDNVVTFYEAVEWARQTGQPTTIMLLDFEKAYDRVDWGFLEGTLRRMGFPDAWTRGISALYRSSSAAVTIGGHVGRNFALSRSVRQGCPLAPYLFLFFAETMALYLRGRTPQIRGLHMPVDVSPDLVEQDYVDDTETVTGEKPDAELVETLIETGEGEKIFKNAIKSQGRGQITGTLAEIQERHEGVRDLEKKLLELHQIFLDMAVLVEAQGEMLDCIEEQATKAAEHTERGVQIIQKAKSLQKNKRKWMLITMILLLIIIVVILVPVMQPWKERKAWRLTKTT
ncbi:hypothetical protein L7F22_026902 [Adiantum nelumboides]|nr:hypothetical protein [Adiantum nelumboides]